MDWVNRSGLLKAMLDESSLRSLEANVDFTHFWSLSVGPRVSLVCIFLGLQSSGSWWPFKGISCLCFVSLGLPVGRVVPGVCRPCLSALTQVSVCVCVCV